jgi:carbon-monoxide dehydrogenase medium subunit
MPDGGLGPAVLAGPAVGATNFRYHRPRDAEEVDALLAEHGEDARLLAGGTDLLVQLRSAARRPAHVVDLVELRALSGIAVSGRQIRVGATTPLWPLEEHPVVRERFVALREGARCVGSLQIQSQATLVGNVCNASPAADTAPALLLYDAVAGVRSARGRREVPLAELWVAPGRTSLAADEWVEHLTLTDPGPHGSCYVKLGRTRGVDLALVGVACLDTGAEVRVACASLAPTPRRLPAVERVLARGQGSAGDGALEQAVSDEVRPISDVRASARYRLAMASVCCRRALEGAARRRREAQP